MGTNLSFVSWYTRRSIESGRNFTQHVQISSASHAAAHCIFPNSLDSKLCAATLKHSTTFTEIAELEEQCCEMGLGWRRRLLLQYEQCICGGAGSCYPEA